MSNSHPLAVKIIKKIKLEIDDLEKVSVTMPMGSASDIAMGHFSEHIPMDSDSTKIGISIDEEEGRLRIAEADEKQEEDNSFLVPPLLAVRLFAHQERIPIGIEEIQRRIGPPESLSQAMILSLLRLNKERAKTLKKVLGRHGIRELPGRSAVVSSFSRLSEAEACGLAEDYFYLGSRHMNVREMHQSLVLMNGGKEAFEVKAEMTRRLLGQILSEIERKSQSLNLLSHEFSSLIIKAVFRIIVEILSFNELSDVSSEHLVHLEDS